jgi:hypothetical protein
MRLLTSQQKSRRARTDIKLSTSLTMTTTYIPANPFEQQLMTTILRRSSLFANALLAIMPTQDKEDLIARFNLPLLRVHRPDSDQNHGADIEVIVLSYFVDSGFNLHLQCADLHCLTPPPSYPIYVQTVGRVARFGTTELYKTSQGGTGGADAMIENE